MTLSPTTSSEMDEYCLQQMLAMNELESMGSDWSFVPFSSNFVSDKRLCLSCVSYVDESIAEQITEQIISGLQREFSGHYFYPKTSLHMTLQSVRSIASLPQLSKLEIDAVAKEFSDVIENCDPIELSIHGLLKLHTSLCLRVYAGKAHYVLVQELRSRLSKLGIADDKKYIRSDIAFGNITICRYQNPPSFEFIETAEKLAGTFESSWLPRQAELISTNAICHPEITRSYKTFRFKL